MTELDEHGRPEPPITGDEIATLLGFLDYQRATLAWKCAGLDPAGLTKTVGVSSMTLGGLLKHLAYVEDNWFSRSLHGRDKAAPWDVVDWKADPDWEWHSAAEDSPEQLQTLWQDAVARSRALVAQALANLDGVSEVYSVAGHVDLIAIVRVREFDQIAEVIAGGISKVTGVINTESHIAFRAYSKHDLEEAFAIGFDSFD